MIIIRWMVTFPVNFWFRMTLRQPRAALKIIELNTLPSIFLLDCLGPPKFGIMQVRFGCSSYVIDMRGKHTLSFQNILYS